MKGSLGKNPQLLASFYFVHCKKICFKKFQILKLLLYISITSE